MYELHVRRTLTSYIRLRSHSQKALYEATSWSYIKVTFNFLNWDP
jgi:hypothetical protein